MGIIADKAKVVAQTAGVTTGTGLSSIISIIEQLLQSFSACTPTAAQVHERIANPGPLEELTTKRLVKRNFRRQPGLQVYVENGLLTVGKTCTVSDTNQLYKEANGVAPAA